jgi:hypothetical protein
MTKSMTAKEQLIKEIEQTPEPIIQEVLDFLLQIRERYQTHKPIWQVVQELMEVIAHFPTDGAYIYGTPKI